MTIKYGQILSEHGRYIRDSLIVMGAKIEALEGMSLHSKKEGGGNGSKFTKEEK